jgi:hypothetical protein
MPRGVWGGVNKLCTALYTVCRSVECKESPHCVKQHLACCVKCSTTYRRTYLLCNQCVTPARRGALVFSLRLFPTDAHARDRRRPVTNTICATIFFLSTLKYCVNATRNRECSERALNAGVPVANARFRFCQWQCAQSPVELRRARYLTNCCNHS